MYKNYRKYAGGGVLWLWLVARVRRPLAALLDDLCTVRVHKCSCDVPWPDVYTICGTPLSLVCSIFGTASEQAADHDNKLANTKTNMEPYYATHNKHLNIWTNKLKNLEESNSELNIIKYDDIYSENSEIASLDKHKMNDNENYLRVFDESKMVGKRREKREDSVCEPFYFRPEIANYITHPHPKNNMTYYSRNINCVAVIEAPKDNVIQLTFVDQFHIEHHPDCDYDYLEIRDGKKGYAALMDKVCGTAFPRQHTSSGHYVWLKFHSDDTIEYEGFKILVVFKPAPSKSVPESCYHTVGGTYGILNLTTAIDEQCHKESTNLDVLWTIKTEENTKIYLNFTKFVLKLPNECDENVVEVFSTVPEMDHRLVQYCGSIANPVDVKDNSNEKGNIMHVRVYISHKSKKETKFQARYTAYRTLNPNIVGEKCNSDEFDCDDNTCIDATLVCNDYANCRLKTDEESCKTETSSTISQPHIMVILIIFSLILSTMSFVFLFKCIRKLYQDHKIIKEHIRESCEDRLDMVGSRLTLDAKRLQRDSEPRASLERENQTNEMFKRKRDSFSKRKPTSIDSDYIHETRIDLDEEPWRREVESVPIEADDIRIERNGRTRRSEKEKQDRRSERERASERQSERRSDMSKKEESIRSKRETEEREKKQIRDVSVGPDTKESGCQTRESLFQADAPPSSDGSGTTGTNSRGFSTFGYSGATIVRPSPPTTNTSEITIELLRQVPRQDSVKPQKKIPDRRPISNETTRSAPDVIIVSKPIR